MGKRYHCDYCNKSMVSAPSIIKTHNKGLCHRMLVTDHYQQYKDAETILSEESIKKPCSRFPRGLCQFGNLCRFSHYTPEHINHLKEIVAAKRRMDADITQQSFEDLNQKLQDERSRFQTNDYESMTLYNQNGMTHVFPWVYNMMLGSYGDNLPPSIRKIKLEDFKEANITYWGSD